MRERLVNLLTNAGFVNVDTNRWYWRGMTNAAHFRLGYASREWTVTYRASKEPVRWRLIDRPNSSIPADLLDLVGAYAASAD